MQLKNLRKNLRVFVFTVGVVILPSLTHAQSVCVGSACGSSGYGQGGPAMDLNPAPGFLPDGPSDGISGIITNGLYWLLSIFSVLAVLGFVISGIMYLLSGANEDLAKKGKAGMTNSIIGIIVGLSGVLIITAIHTFLQGNSTAF